VTSTTSPAPAAATPARVPAPTIAAFGSLGVPLAGLLLITAVYVPRFYVSLGVDFIAVAAAVAIVRLFDIVVDPVLALAMDRTKTFLGRYRPWLILGTPITMLGVHQLLMPQAGADRTYMIVWLLVTYLGASMLTLALASWTAVLATSYNERARIYGWTQAMTVGGSITLLLLPVFTHGKIVAGKAASMPAIGWILICALPVAALICGSFTPDRSGAKAAAKRFSFKDYGFALSRPSMLRIVVADLALTLGPGTTAPLYVYFFKDAKGFSVAETSLLLISYIGAGVIGAPFWGHRAQKLGKHRTVQLACVVYGITQTTLMVLPRVWPHHTFVDAVPTILGMFAVGFCASAFLPLVRAMVADVIDEVRLQTGQDLTSLLYSMVTTTTKIGAAITVTIVFPILKAVGYNGKEGVVNTPHAIFGLEMCYLFAPIILVFVGGAMFFGYGLDAKRHADIRLALEERDEAAALESLTGPVGESDEATAAPA
jgi:GPH family glycoside/pentoside/hexuronide:cation symporter